MNWQLKNIYSDSQVSDYWIFFTEKLKTMLVLANILEDDINDVKQKVTNISNNLQKNIKDNRRKFSPLIYVKDKLVLIENINTREHKLMIEIRLKDD